MSEITYAIGVDLGQSHDYTAISIVETQLYLPQRVLDQYPWAGCEPGWNSPVAIPPEARRMALSHPHPWPAKPDLHLRHLERMRGVPYPEVVRHVDELIQRGGFLETGYALVIDRTGVGMPVYDMFKAAGLRPIGVSIHGGDAVSRVRGGYRTPKRDLVGALQSVLQTGRLQIADGLDLGPELRREAMNFKIKIDPKTAHDSYSHWREGEHDDLVLSVAMAVWFRDYWCRHIDTGRLQRQAA